MAALAAALVLGACAHTLVVTSDPPGQPVTFDGVAAGNTPLAIDEDSPNAIHEVVVGQGASAVTEVVVANRTLSRDAASAALLPLGCCCLFPFYWTAGTDDRVHVAQAISGLPLGEVEGAGVELAYLPADAAYPNGVAVHALVVNGRRVRVMVDRRPFVTSLNYQGLSYPTSRLKVAPEGVAQYPTGPVLSFGGEQEWLPIPRVGIGVGLGYRGWERAVVGPKVVVPESAETLTAPRLGLREWRAGVLARYRQPVLHWDDNPAGLDATLGAGLDVARQTLFDQRDDRALTRSSVAPWLEAGVEAGVTRAVAVFAADRWFPAGVGAPGGVWGTLGAGRENRVVLGLRLFW
jgi:hypothetical protein